ncbi:MAG: hypothetical protein II840_02345 [Kiritimatiellae bacterium]|nr:hypothetical protein [Kiritimatiellia bacterium]
MNKLSITIGVVAVAVTCQAGIKYWDNPAYKAFDVDCYAPGAVWNLDGIRNNGADQPHSTTTTTWKNLGSSGANNDVWVRYQKSGGGWSNTSAPASLDPVDGRNLGSWTENGFTFTGDSEWRASGSGDVAKIETGTDYTIQALVSATVSGQTSSKPYIMSVQQDHFAFYIDKANSKLYWKTQNSTTDNHPFMSGNELGYMTAILNGTDKTATFFNGTAAPTSGDGFRQFATVAGKTDNGYCLCGYTGSDGQFVGTINFYRYYKRVLSDEELAWNRVVDEARFFKRVAPLPVTNVVVATAVAGVEGMEPSGCYAVDGRHVFIAPRVATVGNAKYICTGYTLEAWDGEAGDWGDPVFHARELSCKVETADRVRITWQWMDGDGIATYDVDDYVWDGLEVFYDGICNQGTNVAHSMTATNWVNLGSKGSVNDVFVQRLNAAGDGWDIATHLDPVAERDPGYWTENGFVFNAESRFRCDSPGGFDVGKNYSLQMLVDAKSSDQETAQSYLLGANDDTFAFQLRKSDGVLFWKTLGPLSPESLYPYMVGGTYDYMTAIMKDDDTQTFFRGSTIPTSSDTRGYKTSASASFKESGYCLGGLGKSMAWSRFVGTLKNFRQYSRALTQAELTQNRKVDNWRYFGIPDVTNVIVQSTVPYLRGDEPDGSYAVDSTHTFTAPASATAKGIEYACDGYTVETWDGSAWSGATSGDSNSYAYTTAAGLVRLTWRWRPVRGLRTAADYSFDDYSQAGLLWNYDGIRNQGGTDADHNSSATTWKNLGSAGAAYDLTWNGETTTGEWAPDGYIFRGGPRFRGAGKVGPLKNYTLQTLVDADIADQTESTTEYSYIMNAYDKYFNISFVSPSYNGSAASSICWRTENGTTFMYFHAKDNHYDYATAMMDYDNKKAMMFPDTTIPTEYVEYGPYGKQRLFHQYGSVTSVQTTGYGLGNRNNNGTEGMVGKIKNFRYYDRVLTEEELVRNRNVDAVRYFGALGVTNVFVSAGGGTQAETGAYKVEGEWTFTATTILDKDAVVKPVKCFCTQTLEDGGLTRKTWYEGSSFTYSESDPVYGGKTIYLTWSSRRPGMHILVR